MNDSGHGYQPDADPGADAEKNGTPGQGPAIGESPAADEQSGTPVQAQNAEPPQPQPAQARPRRRRRSLLREFPILVVVALLLAVAIKTFALQAFFIPSASMENTLEINDRILVNKMVYDVRGIHRGDIVVFNGDGSWDSGPEPVSQNVIAEYVGNFESMFGFGHPGEIYVKRVIGLPGDH